VKYLEENAGAVNIKLTPEDLKRIGQAIPAGAAAGLRYPEGGMKRVNA
jgi:aryl-alcohol dehydrogenase-like predicted oxidoreductase